MWASSQSLFRPHYRISASLASDKSLCRQDRSFLHRCPKESTHGLGRAQWSCSIPEQYDYVPTKYGPKTRILATDKARRSIVIMKGSVPGPLSAYNNHEPPLKWSGDIITKLVVGCRPRRSAPSHDPRDIERNPSNGTMLRSLTPRKANTRFCVDDFAGIGFLYTASLRADKQDRKADEEKVTRSGVT